MSQYCHHIKQKGVSLVGAIFIMVALAAVGVAMVTLNPRVTTIEVTASKGNPGEIYNVSRTIQTTISYDGN